MKADQEAHVAHEPRVGHPDLVHNSTPVLLAQKLILSFLLILLSESHVKRMT